MKISLSHSCVGVYCHIQQGGTRASLTKLALLEKNAKEQEESMRALDVKLSLAIEAGVKNNDSMSRMENILMHIVKGLNVDLPDARQPCADAAGSVGDDGTSDVRGRTSGGKLSGLAKPMNGASPSQISGFRPAAMTDIDHPGDNVEGLPADVQEVDRNAGSRSAGEAHTGEQVSISNTRTQENQTEQTTGPLATVRDLCSQVMNKAGIDVEARERGTDEEGRRNGSGTEKATVSGGKHLLEKAGVSSPPQVTTSTRKCNTRRIITRTSTAVAKAGGSTNTATTSKHPRKKPSSTKKNNRKKPGGTEYVDVDVEETQVSLNRLLNRLV